MLLVADFFCGLGTTAAVAKGLERRLVVLLHHVHLNRLGDGLWAINPKAAPRWTTLRGCLAVGEVDALDRDTEHIHGS